MYVISKITSIVKHVFNRDSPIKIYGRPCEKGPYLCQGQK